MFVLAVVLSPIFVVYELKYAKNPVVDMTLFSNHNVRIACLINFLTGASNFGVIFFLPRYEEFERSTQHFELICLH